MKEILQKYQDYLKYEWYNNIIGSGTLAELFKILSSGYFEIVLNPLDAKTIKEYNDVSDIEFFILFKEKKMDALQKKVRNIINGLATCNLIGSQASSDDMRMLLDNILNGGKSYESGGVMF